jgi:hypothetical protein
VFFPGVYLKIPGRFYYRFGKPIPTKGMQAVMTDKQAAGELYLHVKSEVKAMIAYLLEKREEDKFRSILPRMHGWMHTSKDLDSNMEQTIYFSFVSQNSLSRPYIIFKFGYVMV